MGGIFGGDESSSTQNQPLTGVSIQSSANGLPIALLYGTTRIAPNLIEYLDFRAIPHTDNSNSGGKGGGGGSSSTSYTYSASFAFGLCEGPITGITNAWVDKTQQNPAAYFALFTGAPKQEPWAYLTGNHPERALYYPGIAYAAAAGYDLGSSASLPNHNFEVRGKFLLGGGVLDADPKDIITDLLTNPATGVPNAPALGDMSQFSAYCRASGLLLSPCYSEQGDAASIITDLMQLTNAGIYYSDGLLKFTPYGDTSITGNGVTYTPNLNIIANLDDDDFLSDGSNDPITVKRNAIAETVNTSSDACNQVTLEYLNRANAYTAETVVVQDQVSIDTYGLRPMDTITAHQIADAKVAQAAAMLILQRSVYVRATYEFRLGWQWCYLEPTDLVTITDHALGLNLYPVRILSIEEDDTGMLTITAEDAPPGAASHVVADVPQNGGYSVDYNASPGSVSAVCILEPPFTMAAGSGLEVWAGVSGPTGSSVWGGCNVWVSYDGTTYQQMGVIRNPSRLGQLTDAIDAVSTGPLSIELDGMGGTLLSASAADAAALNTLFYVGGANPEFMAYQTATLTGTNTYDLTGLVRGAYGSAEAPHAAYDPIIRLDNTLARSGSLDLSLVGSTIHFKFQSFNVWGGGLESLESLTAYNYTISGLQATGNAVSGLTATAIPGSAVLTQLSWNASPGADHYVIDQSGDGINWQRTGETKATTWADSALFGASTRFRVAAVRALAGSWSASSFLNVSFNGMWHADAMPMWNSNSNTPMWST